MSIAWTLRIALARWILGNGPAEHDLYFRNQTLHVRHRAVRTVPLVGIKGKAWEPEIRAADILGPDNTFDGVPVALSEAEAA